MKKALAILIPVLLVIILGGGYLFGAYYYRHWFCPNTYINGIKVSGQTYSVAESIVSSEFVINDITIVDEDGEKLVIPGEDVYVYDSNDANNAYRIITETENPFMWPYYLFYPHNYVFKPEVRLNEAKLEEILKDSFFADKDVYNENNSAEIEYNKNEGYVFIDNTCHLFDWDKFIEDVKEIALNNGGELVIQDDTYYKDVNHNVEYKQVVVEWNKIEKLVDHEMEYKLASGETVLIDSKILSDFLGKDDKGNLLEDEDGNYYYDSQKVYDFVKNLSDEYDNFYKTKYFNSTRGDLIEIPYSRYTTYGNLMNVDEESKALEEILASGKFPKEREPVYIKKEDRGSFYNNYGNTYVEIDMNNQMMYYYVDGEVKLKTPVVTGCWSNGNMTPQAVCYIVNKATNIWLDGPGYHSFVYHWMCITGQIGIHDATWRAESQFGGEIYRYGGSHGCINTPLQNMHDLFEMMEIGTPVIVFE